MKKNNAKTKKPNAHNQNHLAAPEPKESGLAAPESHEGGLAAPKSDEGGSPLPSPVPHPAERNRNGKVARLPKAVRDQINQMLLDGLPFAKIIQTLGLHAHGITVAHIGSWKAGGYLDWLKEQRLLDECRLRQQLTLDFAREEAGIDGFEAAHKIAVALICEAVAEFGPEAIRQAFKANPLNFMRALNCLPRLTSGGLKCHQRVAEEQEHKAELAKKQQPPSKKGLSPEVRDEMIESLNLM
jgi:hypothetical protein